MLGLRGGAKDATAVAKRIRDGCVAFGCVILVQARKPSGLQTSFAALHRNITTMYFSTAIVIVPLIAFVGMTAGRPQPTPTTTTIHVAHPCPDIVGCPPEGPCTSPIYPSCTF